MELLVGIAMIAILAGWSRAAGGGAYRVPCMNNMRRVQLALDMFVLDNEDYLPSHARFSAAAAAADWEKWKDGSIAIHRFMDVNWHRELGDGSLDQNAKFSKARAIEKSSRDEERRREDPCSPECLSFRILQGVELGLWLECWGRVGRRVRWERAVLAPFLGRNAQTR